MLYTCPSINLLESSAPLNDAKMQAVYQKTAQKLNALFASFGIRAAVNGATYNPSIMTYNIAMNPGVSVRKVKNLLPDISYAVGSASVKFADPKPGSACIGLEIPHNHDNTIRIRDFYGHMGDYKSLGFALGVGGGGKYVCDLAKQPHLLIAGRTGSGKSVCLNSIISSLLLHTYHEAVNLIMIDPKQVELTRYNGVPHLAYPVVTDCSEAVSILKWAADKEMQERYDLMAECGVKDIESYNKKSPVSLSRLVIVIDELADLMIQSKKSVETAIVRIAQLGRACGIHLVVATQRPSREVITGLIKANMPARIAFATASVVDSRVILDRGGAEKLLGHGDMLYQAADVASPIRLQGVYVSDTEIDRIVNDLRNR